VTVRIVLLAAAGLYAMMSFVVARQRREIGIRAVLGADPRRVLANLFSRAFLQIGAGGVVGALAAVPLSKLVTPENWDDVRTAIPIIAAFMVSIGLAATLGPARRGLRIQPTEALRAE
jgi:putative ABC transport system permease protein